MTDAERTNAVVWLWIAVMILVVLVVIYGSTNI